MEGMVSVLISAHNEEKHIGKVLSNLENIKRNEYDKLEVLVGLDGCEDNTENIVRRFKWVRAIKGKERLGKHKMLEKLMKEAKGDIIIIHDADWLLVTNGNFKKLIDVFRNKQIGGIAHYRAPNISSKHSLTDLGNIFASQFLHEYKMKTLTQEVNGMRFVKDSSFPFFTDFFRKDVSKGNSVTLADDAERTIQIMKNGYKILVHEGELPYFIDVTGSTTTFRDIFRQKTRGEVAKRQIQKHYGEYKASFFGFYLPAFFYSMKRALSIFLGVLAYWLVGSVGSARGRRLKVSTKKGWKMRFKR